MESRAKFLGHSLHQQLIVFPLGLLGTSVIFDIVRMIAQQNEFSVVAFWMIGAGIIGGLIAAPFGLVDWLAIPEGTRAKRIGLIHALVNVVALVLFAISFYLRYSEPRAFSPWGFGLSVVGLILAVCGGWLGGELVTRLGIGVDTGANENAPNSLSQRSASSYGQRLP
jgi:uncharacterized membrane protein